MVVHRSRLGLVIAAVVVVGGILGGALFVLGGPESSSSTTAIEPPARTSKPDMTLPSRADEPDVEALEAPSPPAPARPTGSAGVADMRRVAGRLLRVADRTPLADVALRAPGGDVGTTDAQGAFDLLRVPVDATVLVVEIGGRSVSTSSLPADAFDLPSVELLVDTGWMISGLVRGMDGNPVVDARVSWLAGGGAPVGEPAVSDETGRFVLRDVAPGREPESFVTLDVRAPWYQRGEATVRLPGARRSAVAEIILQGSGELAGAVLDENGRVAAAVVRVRFGLETGALTLPDGELSGISDAAGDYRISGVPPGVYVVSARATGSAPITWIRDVVVEVGRTTRLDVVLPAPVTLAGRVTDAAGAGVDGTHVSAWSLLRWPVPDASGTSVMSFGDGKDELVVRIGPGELSGAEAVLRSLAGSTRTDGGGAWRLEGVPPGELVVSVGDADPEAASGLVRDLDAVPGELRDGIDFVLGAGLSLGGRVWDEHGMPVAGLTVVLLQGGSTAAVFDSDDGVRTDAEGRFRFDDLGPELRRLYTHCKGYRQVWVEDVLPGGPDVRIDLEPAPLVEGHVTDVETGQAIARFELVVESASAIMSRGWSSDDGVFLLDTLEVEPHSITVSAEGYASKRIEGVVPRFGVPVSVVFELVPQG